MSEGAPKLLLIDAKNMCHRVYWSHQELSCAGRHTGLLFGFFKALISLHKEYPDYFRIIVWDRGHSRRTEESQKAVLSGIIPSEYKANRVKELTPEIEDMREQIDELKDALGLIRCLQVGIKGVEADDIIYSYAKQNQTYGGRSVIVSSDHDFLQVLDDNTVIFDAMKKELWTKERFKLEFEFDPERWVDVGALQGDSGDNIFGVDGWGPVTACKYIRNCGTVEGVIESIKAKTKPTKKEQVLLSSIPRIMLARSLKKMDVIPDLPKPRMLKKPTREDIERYFLTFHFASILKDSWRLV